MIRRNITQRLLDALSDTPVALINGARQTGKSTLVQAIAKSDHPAQYINLDDATVLAGVLDDPKGFLVETKKPVVIDEVQQAPSLFPAIKTLVDHDRIAGQFLLTGSANIFLVPKISESLSGRIEILTLWPFSQGERNGIKETFVDAAFQKNISTQDIPPETSVFLNDRILQGGYPEVIARERRQRRHAWFESYITTILQRDVRDLAHIEGLIQLPRILAMIAARAPSVVNFSELSRSLAIAQTTLKRYLTLLHATFLIHSLPALTGSLSKRLVKSPKMIMNDTGLMSHLLGVDTLQSVDGTVKGRIMENFVITEILKQISWSVSKPGIFHFRTHTGSEVDVILENRQGKLVGLEVKASSTIGSRDFRGLQTLSELTQERFIRGIILYTGDKVVPFGEKFLAMPLHQLWAGIRQ